MTLQPTVLKHTVSPDELARKRSLGKAIEYCAELGGYGFDKQLEDAMAKAHCPIDKTQLSRWHQGSEGIKWEKLESVMDVCGNDAPVLWMFYQRGYDLAAIREREDERQREVRLLREENLMLRRLMTSGGSGQ